jgi:hypothetical protein
MNTQKFFKDRYVSKYSMATAKVGEKVLLQEELIRIKTGFYSHLVNKCRESYLDKKEEYGKLKSKLPAIAFCGLFNGGHKKENLISYNNLVIIDVDKLPVELIEQTKNKLFSDKYILACWLSPSGVGLKALIVTDSDQIMHKFCFDRIVDHLSANYDIHVDISGSDVCRLCFASFDNNLLCKDFIEAFPMQEDEWLLSLIAEEKNTFKKKIIEDVTRTTLYLQSEKILLYKTEGRNKFEHREMAKKIHTFLKKKKLSITENHQNWTRVAFAVANTFTYDVGKNIFLEFCRLDGPFHDEYKSNQLLEYCYRKRRIGEINFASILYLSVQKGFVVSPIKNKQNK